MAPTAANYTSLLVRRCLVALAAPAEDLECLRIGLPRQDRGQGAYDMRPPLAGTLSVDGLKAREESDDIVSESRYAGLAMQLEPWRLTDTGA